MEIKHWFSEVFEKPESMIDFGNFYIWITGDKVQIGCVEASGEVRMFTDMATLDKFFEAHKQELVRRSNWIICKGERYERRKTYLSKMRK